MAFPLAHLFRRDIPPAPERRSFDAATGGKRGYSFRSFGSTAPETLAAAAPLRSRARHAAANNGWCANGVAAIVAETVGAGIEPVSTHPDEALRPLLDLAWRGFDRSADAEGRTSLAGLLAQMVRACVTDGEAFAVIEEDGEGIRLRHIPAEMVDESLTRDLGGGRNIAAGVEYDSRGRITAYHILPHRPTDVFATAAEPVRVSAADVVHLIRPIGPGQPRGISWLAPVLLTTNELDQLQDALLVGAKVAAMHAGFIVNVNDLGGSPSAYAEAEDPSIEPGTLVRLGNGEDVRFNSPAEAKESIGFAKLTLRQIAAGLGVPEHLLTGDLTGANYSSLRAGLLPFRQRVEQFQYHCIVPQVLDRLWRRVVTHEYLAERLDLPDLAPAFAVEWLMPRPMQVDPLKDVQALREMLDLGLTSRTQAVASLGWNAATLDAEIAADREREAALGLTFGEPK